MNSKLPRVAFLLGLTGLLPQLVAISLTFDAGFRDAAGACGLLYAALILSFLGGLWWGVAAAHRDAPLWIYALAVVPSLVAFASMLSVLPVWDANPSPFVGIYLGLSLLVTPLVDWRLRVLGLVPQGWLSMRLVLSVGLGISTLVLTGLG
jgi:Protein of unknown function (DUF3429)